MNYRDLLYYGIIFFVSIGVSFSPKILLPIMLFIVGLYQFSIYFTINKFCLSYTEPALITVSEEFIEVNHPFAKFSLEALPSNNYETEQNIEIFLEKVSIDPHRFIFTHPYFYSITGISIGDFKSLSYDYGLTKFDLFLLGIVGEESKPNEMTTDVTDRYMVASIKKQFKNFQFNLFVKYSEKFSFTIENIL
ncbi:MAG: hypothetical protein ACTTHG_04385 [Treponemataceae bacterium]